MRHCQKDTFHGASHFCSGWFRIDCGMVLHWLHPVWNRNCLYACGYTMMFLVQPNSTGAPGCTSYKISRGFVSRCAPYHHQERSIRSNVKHGSLRNHMDVITSENTDSYLDAHEGGPALGKGVILPSRHLLK